MWDLWETLISGMQHVDQEIDLDDWMQDPRARIDWAINLLLWMFKKILDSWKILKVKMIWGNHDVNSKSWGKNDRDRYRLHIYWIVKTINYAIQSKNFSIEHLSEFINSYMIWNINHIEWHWDTDIYKKPAHEIISMFWITWAEHHVICMWHLHSLKIKDQQIVKKFR